MTARLLLREQRERRSPVVLAGVPNAARAVTPSGDANPVLRLQRLLGNHAVQRALAGRSASAQMLWRSPDRTRVQVDYTGSSTFTDLPQGQTANAAVVYDYNAHWTEAPASRDASKKGAGHDLALPVLVYPPPNIDPPKIDIFVFFHGMRTDYGEGPKEGSEQVGLWSHLQEAVAGTNRLGIAPQAPETWHLRTRESPQPDGTKKKVTNWELTSAQWQEALQNVGFDGLVKNVLARLSKDLGIKTPLEPGTIHVAGHSAGGHGIIEATDTAHGAKGLGDSVQDVTLQDAGYSFGWAPLMDWFLEGSPGKTVRILISEDQAPDTRSVVTDWFNVSKVRDILKKKGKADAFEVSSMAVPKAKDQAPRPGGFVLQSGLVVKDKTSGVVQGTMVAFLAPGGGHYETVTSSMGAAAKADPTVTEDFLGEAKPGRYRVISEKLRVFENKEMTRALVTGSGRAAKAVILDRDAEVDVVAFQLSDRDAGRFVACVKLDAGDGFVPLSSLAQPTPPAKH